MYDAISALPKEVRELYVLMHVLPDGRVVGIHRLMYHWTLHIGVDRYGYEDRYCYREMSDALADMLAWNGEGDPPGRWHKHPDSGRRRDPDTGETWSQREPQPSKFNLSSTK